MPYLLIGNVLHHLVVSHSMTTVSHSMTTKAKFGEKIQKLIVNLNSTEQFLFFSGLTKVILSLEVTMILSHRYGWNSVNIICGISTKKTENFEAQSEVQYDLMSSVELQVLST